MPTIVIMGERDIADFRAIAHELAHRIPHAREVVIASAGHMPNMEAPGPFNHAVERFLADTE